MSLMNCTTLRSFRSALRKTVNVIPGGWRNTLNFSLHTSIDGISNDLWDSLNHQQSIFLDYGQLKALSDPLNTDVKFYFCQFYEAKTPVGIAVFQIAKLEADGLHERLGAGKFGEALGRKFLPQDKSYLLLCGTAFATGEHGFSFKPEIPVQRAMNGLCEALTEIISLEDKSEQPITAMLIKDFYESSFSAAYALDDCGFRSFDVDANMEMPLLEEWNSLEDYLQSLNSKFRTKAHAAFNRSEDLKVVELNDKEIDQHRDRIQQLYDTVHDRADFKIGHLNCALLCIMKKEMGDKFIFRAYFLEEKIIGFSIAFNAPHQLEAFLVGIDYQYNLLYALYSRILYDYIELGIKLRASKITFGRTAGEIKSTVGAFPIALKCCIRHPGKLSNVLLNIIFKYVEPETFPVRNPYKEVTLKKLVQLGYHHT